MEAILLRDLCNACIDLLDIVLLSVVNAKHDIFCRSKQIDQLEMLMDHTDAVAERILGRADDDLLAVHEDRAAIRIVNARDHVHQRGLSATVFTENGKDLTAMDAKIHVVVCHNASKALGDPSRL